MRRERPRSKCILKNGNENEIAKLSLNFIAWVRVCACISLNICICESIGCTVVHVTAALIPIRNQFCVRSFQQLLLSQPDIGRDYSIQKSIFHSRLNSKFMLWYERIHNLCRSFALPLSLSHTLCVENRLTSSMVFVRSKFTIASQVFMLLMLFMTWNTRAEQRRECVEHTHRKNENREEKLVLRIAF